MVVKSQAILTQLIYDHALRIRMKSEVHEEPVEDTPILPVGVKIGQEGPSGDANMEHLAQNEPSPSSAPTTSKERPDSTDIVGRLNNFITTDIQTITAGRDWLLPGSKSTFISSLIIMLTIFHSFIHSSSSGFEHHFSILDFGMECIRGIGGTSCFVPCTRICSQQAIEHTSWKNESRKYYLSPCDLELTMFCRLMPGFKLQLKVGYYPYA